MAALRSIAVAALALAAAALLVSGGSDADPRTPPALPGLPPPFLGTAVTGDGGMTAAIDAYGDVVDLRPSPAGPALIDNPAARQAAGTVPADTGVVPRVRVGDGPALPLWRADSVRQRYLAGTNVVQTAARFGDVRVVETAAASGGALAVKVTVRGDTPGGGWRAGREQRGDGWLAGREQRGDGAPVLSATVDVEGGARCAGPIAGAVLTLVCVVGPKPRARSTSGDSRGASGGRWLANVDSPPANGRRPPADRYSIRSAVTHANAGSIVNSAEAGDRHWLARAHPLGNGAPGWARATYRRSLLVLHALTERRTGAVAAGARDGWAYVWPRDAATAALAYAAAGYRGEARRVAGFLMRLEAPGGSAAAGRAGFGGSAAGGAPPPIASAARFDGDGSPVPGRGPQGDAAGWIAVAARVAGLRPPPSTPGAWRNLPDYQEGSAGDYLGNAIAAARGEIEGATASARSGSTADPPAESTLRKEFAFPAGLVRRAGDPRSGLDSAAAWAVRPFDLPTLRPAAERTLLALARRGGRFGITPGTGWSGGVDPWTAPTAAAAWSLAALWREASQQRRAGGVRERPASATSPGTAGRAARDRAAALRLLADLRRAATPSGALPERVGAGTGVPTSTTPLAWSHAFAVLALLELWPDRRCIDLGCYSDQK